MPLPVSSVRLAQQRASQPSLLTQRSFHQLTADQSRYLTGLLGKHVNLDFAHNIFEQARPFIQPRHARSNPSEVGLLTLIGFTSAGLDRKFHFAHQQDVHSPSYVAAKELGELENLAKNTILQLALRPIQQVRRNTALDLDGLKSFEPGKVVQFDRLTSVTMSTNQSYTSGNLDMVFSLNQGIVDVSRLSAYQGKNGKGENEGLLDPGSRFIVEAMYAGKENGRPSLNPEIAPAKTILLRQIEEVDSI